MNCGDDAWKFLPPQEDPLPEGVELLEWPTNLFDCCVGFWFLFFFEKKFFLTKMNVRREKFVSVGIPLSLLSVEPNQII